MTALIKLRDLSALRSWGFTSDCPLDLILRVRRLVFMLKYYCLIYMKVRRVVYLRRDGLLPAQCESDNHSSFRAVTTFKIGFGMSLLNL